MPGPRRHGSGLAPAGHAPKHQLGVACQRLCGAQAQALHHAGAKAFYDHIGAGHQLECRRLGAGQLQIQSDRAPVSTQHVNKFAADGFAAQILMRYSAVNPQNVSPHVRQEHAAKRAGANGFKFQHADAF